MTRASPAALGAVEGASVAELGFEGLEAGDEVVVRVLREEGTRAGERAAGLVFEPASDQRGDQLVDHKKDERRLPVDESAIHREVKLSHRSFPIARSPEHRSEAHLRA